MSEATYRVGCAREKITPPLGVSLAGYFHDRVSDSVRDDLFARCVVVESEGRRVALVSCDLICITEPVCDAAREMIRVETGIAPEDVLFGATHTHTGPELRDGGFMPVCDEWVDALPRLLADAVKRAAGGLFDAALRLGRTEVEGYSFNRLFRLKDATEQFGTRNRDDEIVKKAGPIDPELQVLGAMDATGRLRAILVNFALHVDVIGGGAATFISADWPGEMAETIRRTYGEDVVTVFLQGTCGDINHHSYVPSALSKKGEHKAVSVGRGLAGAAMAAYERAEPMPVGPVWGRHETLSIPYYTRDEELLAEVRALKAQGDLQRQHKYLVERFEAWPHDGKDCAAPVQTMQIGAAAVVGLPAEIFVRLGLEIKEYSPAAQTFVAELCNARVSTYVPATDQAERGAYGAKPILSRWLCADAGRRMADAAQAALWASYQPVQGRE